jgi:hypothetical protein
LQFPILQKEIQEFIKANSEVSIQKLALQNNPFPEFNWKTILEQIECRQKSKDKLPTWFNTDSVIYPSKISIEQTSSEKTSAYKASLISGNSIIDLTGGFGVDAYYFSKSFQSVVHCELNDQLSAIVAHNVKQLQLDSIECFAGNSSDILSNLNKKFDWIYIDPSRRNDHKGKVFMLKDCLPNVPDLLDFYLNFTDNILIKTAPLLDIAAGLNELKKVKKIHIVAVDNEVKELLWEISKLVANSVEISTVNLKKEHTEYFQFEWNKTSESVRYSLPQKYLYEPNSAIMKSGGFNEVSIQFNLEKLHPNSHVYTANQLQSFPGRTFEINAVVPFQKKEMKVALEGMKANVTTRNFPDTVDEIRKKWKIKEGGNVYCFFTTDINNDKIVLLCTKI